MNKYNSLIKKVDDAFIYGITRKNHQHYSTVRAVAIDKEGNVASAVSSGGIWLKMH